MFNGQTLSMEGRSVAQMGRVSSSLYGRPVTSRASASGGRPMRTVTRMGKSTGGPFAPIVRVTRDIVGTKRFNKLRGKAISIHSNVIKDFCGTVGADRKVAQGVIRLAKKNGEYLGFLA